MPSLPTVDVNLFVYNGAATVGAAIGSVLAQTWPALTLTLIDDGSTDGTADVLAGFAAQHAKIRLKRNRRNGGAIANFQRALWFGDADFVMPKSGDDLLAPDFVEKTMAVLLENPACAMCHAAGLIFTGVADVRGLYPPEHCLSATGENPVARARHVMARYTTSPSFWGVYRRDAVDRLARIRHRAGWDHAVLAELALYGEIRHVAEPLYWRRDGGKPVLDLARASTERGSRGLKVTDPFTEPHWRTPLLTTAFAHLETFSVAHISDAERAAVMRAVPDIFRARWLPALRREVTTLRGALGELVAAAGELPWREAIWTARGFDDLLHVVAILLPEEDFFEARHQLGALAEAARQKSRQRSEEAA
jgi:Glycosyl transferase family 2